jgi:predicted AAA+ superfamily ATPase
MIIRKQLITLQERMCEPRQFIQLLAGTRQVGKTTLVKQFVLTYTRKITSNAILFAQSKIFLYLCSHNCLKYFIICVT